MAGVARNARDGLAVFGSGQKRAGEKQAFDGRWATARAATYVAALPRNIVMRQRHTIQSINTRIVTTQRLPAITAAFTPLFTCLQARRNSLPRAARHNVATLSACPLEEQYLHTHGVSVVARRSRRRHAWCSAGTSI